MSRSGKRILTWAAAIAAIALVTLIGRLLGLNAATVGFLYLVVVLLISVWGDLLVGTVSSVIATVCYNFFYFPPLYTLTLADPANWFTLPPLPPPLRSPRAPPGGRRSSGATRSRHSTRSASISSPRRTASAPSARPPAARSSSSARAAEGSCSSTAARTGRA